MCSGFSVRERGLVRVLLLVMIVLFSSVQCLYSSRLQEGSRVKQGSVFGGGGGGGGGM